MLAEVPGALVEDKRWGVSAHYRLADERAVPLVERVVRETAAREGLRVTTGKKVLELRAPVDVNKGTAALALLERLNARDGDAGIAFIGDDVTDEDAFRRLRSEVPRALTVRVGPPDVETAAGIVVDDPAAVRALLELLV